MEVNNAIWEKETQKRINEARNKQKYHESEASHWREYADALSKALTMQQPKIRGTTNIEYLVSIGDIKNQSIRETLIKIARSNDGILKVIDAVSILMDAEMFTAREKARNSVYANIYNNKKLFQRDSPGVYRLKNTQNIMLPFNS